MFQIEGICVNPSERDKGLATRLYEALILRCGVTLISDFEQYDGGKMLWQKIARESEYISVFITDTEQNAFWPYDGSKVIYDGDVSQKSGYGACHQIQNATVLFWWQRKNNVLTS